MPMDRSTHAAEDGQHIVVARYVADLAAELATLARGQRLDLLAYFLDMAVLEAENQARGAEAAE